MDQAAEGVAGHETEAACLLRTGAQFPRRTALRGPEGATILIGARPGGVSIYHDDEPIYHFDPDGRWQRAFIEGVHYRKGLDGSADAIDRRRDGPGGSLALHRRVLPIAESAALDAAIREAARDLAGRVADGSVRPLDPPPPAQALDAGALLGFLGSVAAWDAAAWSGHRDRYAATYAAPLPPPPPDAPGAVVLQATIESAIRNPQSAIRNPQSERSAIRNPDELAEHARAVVALWGRRLAQARAVVLAGPEAMQQPTDRVAAWLEAAASVLPLDHDGRRARPRAAEADPDAPPRLDGGFLAALDCYDGSDHLADPAAWRRLATLGLRRVVCDLAGPVDGLTVVLAALRDGGVAASLLVDGSVADPRAADGHAETVAERLATLPLGPGSIVYLLDPSERPGGVPVADLEAQQARLRARLDPLRKALGLKVVPFSYAKTMP